MEVQVVTKEGKTSQISNVQAAYITYKPKFSAKRPGSYIPKSSNITKSGIKLMRYIASLKSGGVVTQRKKSGIMKSDGSFVASNGKRYSSPQAYKFSKRHNQ